MAYCLNPVCPQPQNQGDANFCSSCGSSLILADRSRPESLLGKGGFGRTILARAIATGSCCVIKQIYSVPTGTSSAFESETQRLEQLGKHPQIPRLLAAVENELGQFLVQEFAPGETLEVLVQRDGAWEEGEVRSLLSSLVAVLQYVHSFKVIHRDIKPANIVRGEGGDRGSLMLVDFGAAKWIERTVAKTAIGSAGYAAPEQAMGQATFASDVYSLGLTCLHLLTGLHPFELYSAVEDRWVWRDYLPVPVSAGFGQVLDRMVGRSLQERYATMDAVVAGLKESERSSTIGGQLLERARAAGLPLEGVLRGNRLSGVLKKIASGQPTNSLPPVIFEPQSWQLHRRVLQSVGLIRAIAVSSRVPIFATAGGDRAVRLWDSAEGKLLHSFARKRFSGEGHRSVVTDVQFHPDGRALYSASDDGTVKEWDSEDCVLMNTLRGGGWTPTALAVSPDGAGLASANSDGRIAIWDIATLEIVGQLAQHQNRVNAVAISEAGDFMVSAGEDSTVRLWRYASGGIPQLVKVVRVASAASALPGFGGFAEERGGAIAVALQRSEGGCSYLVVATCDTVWRYEVTAQLEVRGETAICRSEQAIRAIALSQDGTLAVGTEDRVMRLWQLATGECVAELKHDWGVSAIAFSTDGETLISASADETLFVWRRIASNESLVS